MNVGDLVVVQREPTPVIGEIVAFTPKRVRITLGRASGYATVLRAQKNLTIAKKGKRLI